MGGTYTTIKSTAKAALFRVLLKIGDNTALYTSNRLG